MSIEDYKKAVGLLEDRSIDVYSGTGATDTDIVAIETRLDVRLPRSYRAMLAQFGALSFEGIEIYGWTRSGLDGKSIPNVVFATEYDRKRELISNQMVAFMSAGYGPTFVLDCAEIDADGEAPVYEISAGGVKRGKDRLADTFGAFFLEEVERIL